MSASSKPSRPAVNKIFGDELPRTSTDERENDSSVRDLEHDNWLRENVPPHHE